jgi:hypothetical protein
MNTTADRRATQSTVIAIHHIPPPARIVLGRLAFAGWLDVRVARGLGPVAGARRSGASRVCGGGPDVRVARGLGPVIGARRPGRPTSPGSPAARGLRPAIRSPPAASGTSRSPCDCQQRLVAQATAVARHGGACAASRDSGLGASLATSRCPWQRSRGNRRGGGAAPAAPGTPAPASAGCGFAAHREASTWFHHAALSRAVPAQGRPRPARCRQRCRHQPAQIRCTIAAGVVCQSPLLPTGAVAAAPSARAPLRPVVAAGPTHEHGVPAASRGAAPQPWEERVSPNPPTTARRA